MTRASVKWEKEGYTVIAKTRVKYKRTQTTDQTMVLIGPEESPTQHVVDQEWVAL